MSVLSPNTALLSLILTSGCFIIAYFLKQFRSSPFLSTHVRKALGDFGVPIAILVMTGLDLWLNDKIYTKVRANQFFLLRSVKNWFGYYFLELLKINWILRARYQIYILKFISNIDFKFSSNLNAGLWFFRSWTSQINLNQRRMQTAVTSRAIGSSLLLSLKKNTGGWHWLRLFRQYLSSSLFSSKFRSQR